MRSDAIKSTSQFKHGGSFYWPSNKVSFARNLEIELFIKDHPLPTRTGKLSEVHTVDMWDHRNSKDVSTHMIFETGPSLLTTNISGWMITPWTGVHWDPRDAAGASIYSTVGNISHAQLVAQLLEGMWTAGPHNRRLDPAYYVDPYGHQYNSVVIANYEYGVTVHPRKQTFSATLYLEK